VLLTLCVLATGCQCTQNVTFEVIAQDVSGQPIPSVTVQGECHDVDGTTRRGATLIKSEVTEVRMVAPSRSCPDNAGSMSSYFTDCSLSVIAVGFVDQALTLTGEDIDRLDQPDQSGHHVPVHFTMVRP
jgi:hypothetical protein